MIDFKDFIVYLGESNESSVFTRRHKIQINDFIEDIVVSALFLRIQPEHLKKLLSKTFDDNVSYFKRFYSNSDESLF